MEVSLKEISKIVTGNTPSKKNKNYWNSKDICFIKPDVIGSGIDSITTSNEYISNSASSKARIVDRNTILITCIGNIGRIGIISDKKVAFNQQINAIIPNYKINIRYLAYVLLFSQPRLNALANSAVVPIVNKTQLGNFKVKINPNLESQGKIVSILDKIAKIIKKQTKEIEHLDELIKARFVEMFGDPVLNSKKYPEKALENYINFITSGSRGWAKYLTPKGKAWFLTIKNVKNSHIVINNIQSVEPPDSKEAQRTKVKEGDLLISITADLGRTGVVSSDIASHGTYINQHLTCIRLNTEFINPVYASYFLETVAGKRQFNSKNQNGVKAGLNFDAIKSLKIIIPPIKRQNSFVSFVEQVDKSKFENIVYLNKTLSSKILSQIGDVIRD
ncbi:restriction endonuclease subunit S [Lactobacillus johnsonii]|nr:restriction endonuclease subunit S [Lactobacillus johnsonii]